ncbi:BTAD domain-containing putative transcriptional regulator [Streptomyces sp. NPDC058382]|uniref:AfsR/SARP family transcriptional regulator n=1 Tax=unclassified Streptomyces TaxID=2593676 RepID=UPI0036415E74
MRQVVFRILGPLNVSADGRPVVLQGGRQRTIMSMLLLAPDRVVSVDALADAVWRGNPPVTARNQIAICVSALRKTIKNAVGVEDLLVTSHPGYVLHAGEHRIDAVEFEDRAARGREAARLGRIEEARDHFEVALAMWRGPALEGVLAERVEAEAARLTEMRLDVYEEQAGLRLQLGQHRELIGELSGFVREHPLREQVKAHLMLAQYRSGRRAEALETYREGQRILAGELGIAPGPALQELHEQILADSPELGLPAEISVLASPTAVPAHLPPSVASFTGRRTELASLDRLLEHLNGSALPVGSITGTGGVGKTALAVQWAHQVAARFPDGQLFADMRGYDGEELPRRPGAVLDTFLRALGVPGSQIPAELAERTALFRSVLDGRRVLVVLDNALSFQQIQPLLPGNGRSCVLVTSRDSMGSALAGDYCFVPMQLGSLEQDEAIALLSGVAGDARFSRDPVGAARLSELCDRLPLALRIAAARLAAKPHWSVRTLVARLEDQHRRLDELTLDERGVRAGLRLSYRDLPPDTARMFRLLGVLGVPDFAAWAGAALLGIDPVDAEDLIEQLVDAQLLEPLRGANGLVRYRFQDLLRLFARECAEAEDSETDRLAATGRARGAWLGLADEAHRRVYGGDRTVIHGPAQPHPLPGDLVEDLLSNPMEWFESERVSITALVEHAVMYDASAYAWDLAMTSVELFRNRNHLQDRRHRGERALEAAVRCGDAMGEAVVLHSLGTPGIDQWSYDPAHARLPLALRLTARAEAQSTLGLAEALLHEGDGQQVRAAARRAPELVRGSGDRRGEAHASRMLGAALWCRGKAQETEALLRRAPTTSAPVPDRYLEARAALVLGCVQALRADRAGAADSFRAAQALFGEVGTPTWQKRCAQLLLLVEDGRTIVTHELFALVRP